MKAKGEGCPSCKILWIGSVSIARQFNLVSVLVIAPLTNNLISDIGNRPLEHTIQLKCTQLICSVPPYKWKAIGWLSHDLHRTALHTLSNRGPRPHQEPNSGIGVDADLNR